MNSEQEGNKTCSICGEENDDYFHTLDCGHTFHYHCLFLSFKNMKNNNCPYCRSSKNLLPVINGVKKLCPEIHEINHEDMNTYQIKTCEHVLTRGKNKGKTCSKNCKLGYNYCSTHFSMNKKNIKG